MTVCSFLVFNKSVTQLIPVGNSSEESKKRKTHDSSVKLRTQRSQLTIKCSPNLKRSAATLKKECRHPPSSPPTSPPPNPPRLKWIPNPRGTEKPKKRRPKFNGKNLKLERLGEVKAERLNGKRLKDNGIIFATKQSHASPNCVMPRKTKSLVRVRLKRRVGRGGGGGGRRGRPVEGLDEVAKGRYIAPHLPQVRACGLKRAWRLLINHRIRFVSLGRVSFCCGDICDLEICNEWADECVEHCGRLGGPEKVGERMGGWT